MEPLEPCENITSGLLSRQACEIIRSNDRTYAAYQKLEDLGSQADGAEADEIGWFIEAFIADGGQITEPIVLPDGTIA